MAQVTLYLDTETESKMKAAARSAGVSQSRWVADLIREKTATQWPESLVKLAGTWSDDDFPSLEEIREGIGEDAPRETF
ncbi:MAG TPA: CopG family transcriptional regulator [Thermoanaerobaculia bacterium]|nr:CopG family transcriptional regulator [Thermoanaerobaculia bacterium]